jgi:hypothetical protein
MEAGFSCATVIRNRSMALCRNAAFFDIPEAVKTFYDSDAYQAVPPFRLNAGTSNGFTSLLTGVR